MPVYFFTGKLGSGKTLCAVGKARDYLGQSRRVASNIDIDVTKLGAKTVSKQAHIVRIPDKPTAADMEMLGYGYGDGSEEYDENKFGLILLDELGTWFNSRNWNDKSRKGLIDWAIHARKFRWDVAFLVQDIVMVDGQLRDGVCEFLCVCKRADRVKILGLRPPKIHVVAVYNASRPDKNAKFERWVYRGRDLYGAYDTGQVFSTEYDKGTYCPLQKGYFDEQKTEQNTATASSQPAWRRIASHPIAASVAGIGVGAFAVAGTNIESVALDPVQGAENQEIHGAAPDEEEKPVSWLQGIAPVYYAGSIKAGRWEQHLFSSAQVGSIDGQYFYGAGGQIKKLSPCAVSVQWPDGRIDVIKCAPYDDIPAPISERFYPDDAI